MVSATERQERIFLTVPSSAGSGQKRKKKRGEGGNRPAKKGGHVISFYSYSLLTFGLGPTRGGEKKEKKKGRIQPL